VGIWYTTRESVMGALDAEPVTREYARFDEAIETSARDIETLCHRSHFYPWLGTRYFDWPDENNRGGRTWRLPLGDHTLISLTSITAGGVAIATGDVNLEPRNSGPPYRRIEIDLSSAAAFSAGDTHQQAIAILGLWGDSDVARTVGALAEALDNVETGVDVTDVSDIGVGTLLRCEDERMVVTAKGLLDSGQNLGTTLGDETSDDIVNLSSGAAFHVGEVITIDSERMLLVDIAGNNGVVHRAVDGSVLAAHTAPADIYVARTLTVERGAVGTAAVAHNTATALTRWVTPSPVESLNRAEAQTQVLNEQSGWVRTVGDGEAAREAAGKSIDSLRNQVLSRYGRRLRSGAV
jgi:hypothetical protein